MKHKVCALSLILFIYGVLPAVPENHRDNAAPEVVTDAQLHAIADQHEPDPRWWVNALNTVQHFSSRRWLHQEDVSELIALGGGGCAAA